MTTERWQRIEELFTEALELPPTARDAFVTVQSGDDGDLAREVATLLANSIDDGALRAAVSDAVSSFAQDGRHIGARLGPYRVVALIGEGGMGAVYRATRDDGEVAYDVALKILRHELASAHAIARFRDERQILATLDHPAIVRLLDGGSTDDDLPYLVMELVDGEPITAYVQARPIRERIAMIIRVAEGLAYAHQRLVVHRDIKPSNILVDAGGAPKLVDFGIAKLLGASAREAPETRTGMALLTPEYASPEQARGEAVAVASDVYSLGAVLYEVLTGRPPLTLGASMLETLEAICERDPLRPSTVAPVEHRREIAGDLDSITLKALQKQPEQRYASIAAFVDDLERYLDGLPVRAREATRRYRAGKFVARNRGTIALAVVVFGALSAATGISLHQAHRADRQAERAEAQQRRLVAERGWQEVLGGHAGRALPYLVEALRSGDDAALRFLIAEALRPFEAEIAVVPFPGGLSLAAWSPDGKQFALAGQGGLSTYDTDGHPMLTLFDSSVWRIAWSLDGARIAAAIEGHVRVWDLAGRVVVDVPATMPARVAWLPDGALVLVEEHRLVVFDGTSARFDVALPADDTVTGLTVFRDGRRIALGSARGRVQLFDAATGASSDLVGHTGAVVALTTTSDGHLISVSHDRTARIWNASGAPIATLAGHNHIIEALALSHDEKRVATCSRDGTVKVWDTHTGAFVVEVRGHDNGARGADFSSDGRQLVTTGGDSMFRIWDLATGTLDAQYEARFGGGSRPSAMSGTIDVQWSPTGDRIIGIAGAGAKVLRATRAPLLVELDTQLAKPTESQPRSAAFSPDEQRVAIVGLHQVEIWDVRTASRLLDLTTPADGLVWDVAWSHDAGTIAVVGRDLSALVPLDGGARIPLVGHRGTVNRVVYAPDGTRLVTAGSDGTIRIWDATTGREVGILRNAARTSSAAWSHDGARLVTASADGMLRIWDVASRTVAQTIVTGERYLDVAWSPDDQALAVAAHGGTVAVWTLDGSRRFIASGHTGPVTSVPWSPDGALLATSADDQTARIWDARTGKLLAIRRHRNGAMSAAWSRDGTRLLTASTDGSARIWDVHREPRDIAELDALLARYLQLDRLDGNHELGD